MVPLARDPEGNPIELPQGTVGWRVRRQTGGRPRLVLDSRKVPMTFPLDYTIADAEDILPPGNYLLDGIDERGEPTDVTVALSIGAQRNAEPPEEEKEGEAVLAVPRRCPVRRMKCGWFSRRTFVPRRWRSCITSGRWSSGCAWRKP
jgi:hypothetical protein